MSIFLKVWRPSVGTDDLENLKLLCRSCNQRRAIEMYGVGKMQQHLHGLPN